MKMVEIRATVQIEESVDITDPEALDIVYWSSKGMGWALADGEISVKSVESELVAQEDE